MDRSADAVIAPFTGLTGLTVLRGAVARSDPADRETEQMPTE